MEFDVSMKFHADRNQFANTVAWVARALPTKPTVPVLAGMRLDLQGGKLTVSGFDYETSAQVTLDVDTRDDGTLLVSGRLLAEIVKSLPSHPINMSTDGSRVVLTCGPSRFTLPTLTVDDYPTLPAMPEVAGTISSDLLATAVQQVAVAANKDNALPVLTTVRLEIDGDSLTLAATDRYRLAVRELAWQALTPDQETAVLVPAQTLTEIARNPEGNDTSIALSDTTNGGAGMIGFQSGGRRTTTRLLDGEYPRYKALFPENVETTAYVEVEPLVEAVRRVALVAPRNAHVQLTFRNDGLQLDAGGADEAQASETLDVDYNGGPFAINFNPGYLVDGLNAVGDETAMFSLTDPLRPAVITGKGSDDYRYLLMPVRVIS